MLGFSLIWLGTWIVSKGFFFFFWKIWISWRVYYFVGILKGIRDIFTQLSLRFFFFFLVCVLNLRFRDIFESQNSPV